MTGADILGAALGIWIGVYVARNLWRRWPKGTERVRTSKGRAVDR